MLGHIVDTGISQAVRLKRIENDIALNVLFTCCKVLITISLQMARLDATTPNHYTTEADYVISGKSL